MNKNCLYFHLLLGNWAPLDKDFRDKCSGSPPTLDPARVRNILSVCC